MKRLIRAIDVIKSLTKNEFINQVLKDKYVILERDGSKKFVLVQVNENNFKDLETTGLLDQLKEEGKINWWYGFNVPSSENPPYNFEWLPVYGNSNKWETKWLCSSPEQAIESAIKYYGLELIRDANKYIDSINNKNNFKSMKQVRDELVEYIEENWPVGWLDFGYTKNPTIILKEFKYFSDNSGIAFNEDPKLHYEKRKNEEDFNYNSFDDYLKDEVVEYHGYLLLMYNLRKKTFEIRTCYNGINPELVEEIYSLNDFTKIQGKDKTPKEMTNNLISECKDKYDCNMEFVNKYLPYFYEK